MNRKYTKEQYLELANKIKKAIPNVLFTTDIIVGFPGETEEDFLETMDVVRKVRYYSAFTFVYSRRVGTPADKMLDQVDEDIKSERIGRLIKLVNDILEEENEKLVGTVQKVLVEGYSEKNKDMLTGRTDGGKVVNFEGDSSLIGNMVELKITEQRKWYLAGKLL
jgi:tRNA-2-methylthio-N6-dimethylallyladenosine synthase